MDLVAHHAPRVTARGRAGEGASGREGYLCEVVELQDGQAVPGTVQADGTLEHGHGAGSQGFVDAVAAAGEGARWVRGGGGGEKRLGRA